MTLFVSRDDSDSTASSNPLMNYTSYRWNFGSPKVSIPGYSMVWVFLNKCYILVGVDGFFLVWF